MVSVIILFPTVINVILYLIQDSFIKKSDFETTSVEIMIRFYEFFDASKYQNTNRMIQEPTIIDEKEIAEGNYETRRYEDNNNILGSLDKPVSGSLQSPLISSVKSKEKGGKK